MWDYIEIGLIIAAHVFVLGSLRYYFYRLDKNDRKRHKEKQK